MRRPRSAKKQKTIAEINITPFTDIVLVLLIIFMVATPLIVQDNIKVNLPEASKTSKSDGDTKNITVSIDAGGDVFIGKVRYALATDAARFKDAMVAQAGSSKNPALIINDDRNCRYDSVIAVIDLANQAGIRKTLLGVDLKKRSGEFAR